MICTTCLYHLYIYIYIAYDYFVDNGAESAKSYPYVQQVDNCKYDKSKRIVQPTSFVRIESGSESALTQSVADLGPITAGIYAAPSLQFYSSGVYFDSSCPSDNTDMGGLVVGYGTMDGDKDYYLFRNSWGTNWVNIKIYARIIHLLKNVHHKLL